MDRIDKVTLQWLRKTLNTILAEFAAEEGISLKLGNCTFTPSNFIFKLEGALINADGVAETKERDDFKYYATMYGLNASDLDKEFVFRNEKYKVVGLNPRSRKYPINVVRLNDGKRFRMPNHVIKF